MAAGEPDLRFDSCRQIWQLVVDVLFSVKKAGAFFIRLQIFLISIVGLYVHHDEHYISIYRNLAFQMNLIILYYLKINLTKWFQMIG